MRHLATYMLEVAVCGGILQAVYSLLLEGGYDRELYMNAIFRQLFGYSPEIANGLRDSLTKNDSR